MLRAKAGEGKSFHEMDKSAAFFDEVGILSLWESRASGEERAILVRTALAYLW
jgi:hypothetical protein